MSESSSRFEAPDETPLVDRLVRFRAEECFPPGVPELAASIAERCLGLMYPQFAENRTCTGRQIGRELAQLEHELEEFAIGTRQAVRPLADHLPALREEVDLDGRAILDGDPAATSLDEVILCYPGFLAVAVYRLAHRAWGDGWALLPRLLSEWAHRRTGVDIHPGATIGPSLCIDHGTGLVVGETAVIGTGVRLYQGVTLGALAVRKEMARTRRHPTLEDGVVVYANATILGGTTVIGRGSIVGGGAWVTRSVPPDSLVAGHDQVRHRHAGEVAFDWVI